MDGEKLTCTVTSKVVHRYAKGARLAARRMRAKTGDILTPYACGHCNGWHIGHTPYFKQKRYKLQIDPKHLRVRRHGV